MTKGEFCSCQNHRHERELISMPKTYNHTRLTWVQTSFILHDHSDTSWRTRSTTAHSSLARAQSCVFVCRKRATPTSANYQGRTSFYPFLQRGTPRPCCASLSSCCCCSSVRDLLPDASTSHLRTNSPFRTITTACPTRAVPDRDLATGSRRAWLTLPDANTPHT